MAQAVKPIVKPAAPSRPSVFARGPVSKMDFFKQKASEYQQRQLVMTSSLADKVAAADQAVVLLSKPTLTQEEVQQLLELHEKVR